MHLMKILCRIAMEEPAGKPTTGNTKAVQAGQDSRFPCLSPELRNIIYEEVLVDAEHIEIPKDGKLIRPPLLKVSRQIAEEAGTIFYGLNTFTSTHNKLEDIPLWVARLPMKLRRSVKVMELRYEVDTEVRIMARYLAAEAPLGYDLTTWKTYENAERRSRSAYEKFQSTIILMALLGVDLNVFRFPPLPPLFHEHGKSTDCSLQCPERLVRIFERSWIRSANMHISRPRVVMAEKSVLQCRGYEQWLRRVAVDNKAEDVMARLPQIISLIQG